MAYTYSKIATVTVGSGGASSIDFTSIPSTYTDLMVRVSGRLSVTDIGVYMYFNSDTTAANYSFINVYGNGANTFSINSSAEAIGTYLNESGYTASTFGSSDIYIPNYTSSNKKSFSTDTTTENNATTSYAVLLAGLWSGTSAITGIKLQPRTSGNFVQYSTATLYGIKAEV